MHALAMPHNKRCNCNHFIHCRCLLLRALLHLLLL